MFVKIMKELEHLHEIGKAMYDESEILGEEDNLPYYDGYMRALEDLKANLEELAKDERWS